MSENTTNSNGTATIDPSALAADPELLAQLLVLKAKDDERKAKLEAAKEARKRSNDRGKNADGTERSATQAFVVEAAALMANWAESYEEDPAQLVRRIREQFIPALTAVGNTASTQMAGAQDQFRQLFKAYRAPAKATAPTGKDSSK